MRTGYLSRQKGIATVLILLLTGLTLSIMVFGTMSYVRATQSALVTSHDATQAQLRAWTGVELVRKYLEAIGWNSAKGLTSGTVLTFSNISGLRAVVSQAPDTTNKYLTVNITGCSDTTNTKCTDGSSSTTSGAVSGIQVVYSLSSSSSSSSGSGSSVVNIKGNVSANGAIAFSGTGGSAVINVDGNFSSSSGISGITALYTTGSITIGGSGASGNLFLASNGDITLSGSGSYGTLQTLGNVTMSGSTTAINVVANGTVDLSNASVTNVTVIGDVTISGGNTSVGTVTTKGNTTLSGGSAHISTLRGTGNLTEKSNSYVLDGIVGGSVKLSGNALNHVVSQSGYSVSITPLTAVTVQSSKVDANDYKSNANYVFTYDGSNIKVKVSNVNGITDGDYYLYEGKIGNTPYYDYLCTSSNPSSASQCIAKIAKGYSDYNSSISWKKGTFTLAGTTMAPGIAWFDGDLEVSNGTYYDTFIATGNISTSGSSITYAVNYAGYSNICTNSNFPSLYPTNLCNKTTGTLITSLSIANVALLAGSYTGTVFSGGNIDLGANNQVYGDIVAGNILTTHGSTTVHGYLGVANQSGGSTATSLGGSTTIDLTSAPSSYTGGLIGGAPTTNTGTSTNTTVLWARYL